MKRQIDYDDLIEVAKDIQAIEVLIVHLESSEYYKGLEEDTFVLRAIRNSLECIKNKVEQLLKEFFEKSS